MILAFFIISEAYIFLPALFLAIVAYLLGSIPTGVILSKYFGDVDIRKVGSGNIGATNVTRTLGKKVGALTLLGDLLKGFIPTFTALLLINDINWTALIGFSAFLGHIYSVFLEFKGGKGVATALGVLIAASPASALAASVTFCTIFAATRYVSAGSIMAAIIAVMFASYSSEPFPIIVLMFLICVIILLRHKENMQRLLEGKEGRVSFR